jgi:hypothetical protein
MQDIRSQENSPSLIQRKLVSPNISHLLVTMQQTVFHLSLRGAQRRSNPSSPFDKLRAPRLSRGWIAAPSFLGLAMTMKGEEKAGLRLNCLFSD